MKCWSDDKVTVCLQLSPQEFRVVKQQLPAWRNANPSKPHITTLFSMIVQKENLKEVPVSFSSDIDIMTFTFTPDVLRKNRLKSVDAAAVYLCSLAERYLKELVES